MVSTASRVALLLSVALMATVTAEEIVIDWRPGVRTESPEIYVGDTVVFNYKQGAHDVVKVDAFSCSESNIAGGETLAGFDTSTYTFKAEKPGVTTILCSVPGHCQEGQIIDIIVLTGEDDPYDQDNDGTADISTLPTDVEIPEGKETDPEFLESVKDDIQTLPPINMDEAEPTPAPKISEEEALDYAMTAESGSDVEDSMEEEENGADPESAENMADDTTPGPNAENQEESKMPEDTEKESAAATAEPISSDPPVPTESPSSPPVTEAPAGPLTTPAPDPVEETGDQNTPSESTEPLGGSAVRNTGMVMFTIVAAMVIVA